MKARAPWGRSDVETSGAETDGLPTRDLRSHRQLPLEWLVVATLALFGLRVGLQPIHDNSMLLHLRTGIDMARTGHVPRTDPYSFTAPHHPWVIQSWFAELLYGIAYRLGGIHLVVVEQGLLMASLAGVVASIARAGTTARTMASAGITVGAGVALWSQRPLLFGLLALALVILVVERRRSPWWLLPIGWVWVNTHGSFPLGLLWLGAVYVGSLFDQRRRPRHLEPYLAAFVGSLVLGAVNPIGPRLIAFPLVVESKHAVFATIVEWRSPNFQQAEGLFALVFFSLALLVLLRRGGPWGDILAVVGFLALGLVSVRNLAPAAVVLAPALGRALRPKNGAPVGEAVGPVARPVKLLAVVLALAAVVFFAAAYRTSGLNLRSYPVGAEVYLRAHGMLDGRRIATQDYVGDYRELVERVNPSKVFIDDRYDMYPASVSADYDRLLAARPDAVSVLAKWEIQVVMWGRNAGLPDELRLAGGWRTVYSDRLWQVLVKDPSVPPEAPAS